MTDFLIYYVAVALSAAIFATYTIYLPILELVEKKAKESLKAAESFKELRTNRTLSFLVFFIGVMAFFPIVILPLLFESFRQTFIEGFVKGYSD